MSFSAAVLVPSSLPLFVSLVVSPPSHVPAGATPAALVVKLGVHLWLNAWSPTQLKSKCEAAVAAGGSAASGVEGPQAPGKFGDFALGKRSKDASIMCHFNQKNTTHSME